MPCFDRPPIKADFLYVHCTQPKFTSYRYPETGSIFIQYLCEVLEEHSNRDDFLSNMTRVNAKVTQHRVKKAKNLEKQCTSLQSTLTKKIRFKFQRPSLLSDDQVTKVNKRNLTEALQPTTSSNSPKRSPRISAKNTPKKDNNECGQKKLWDYGVTKNLPTPSKKTKNEGGGQKTLFDVGISKKPTPRKLFE